VDGDIITDRLLLRRFRPGDLEALHAYVSREDVAQFTSFGPRTRAQSETELKRKLADPPMDQAGQMLSRAAVLPGTGQLIGEVLVFVRDVDARQGEIGYVFHPDFQGQGYALEAARAMLGYGFETLEFHRVFARSDARHTASVSLLEKLGMRREAHFREHAIFKGEWDNLYIYAMLEDEWAALKRDGK